MGNLKGYDTFLSKLEESSTSTCAGLRTRMRVRAVSTITSQVTMHAPLPF